MAIHMMSDAENAHYSMPFYHGHEYGLIRHGKACPHCKYETGSSEIRRAGLYEDCVPKYGPIDPETKRREINWDGCDGPSDPLYMQISYEGCVLGTGEHNGRDDSDFYAIVWDESEQRVREIQYATTRGWTYPNSAEVDATPEVVAKAEAYYAKLAEQRRAAELEGPSLQTLEAVANEHYGYEGYVCELKETVRTRASVQCKCSKCDGKGYWQNPNRPNDKRTCFGCGGTKVRKNAAPKGTPMVIHQAGKRGRPIRTFEDRSQYGTWVRSRRVELQADDGELFTVDASKVRLVSKH